MRGSVVVLAVMWGTTTVSAQGRAADEAAIRAHTAAVENALNKRDAAAVVALFTADGDEINTDGPRRSGRDAMRSAGAADLAAWSPTMRFSLSVTGIRFLTADIAIVETAARFTEGPVRANRGTAVLVRQDGQWLTAALRVYPAQRAP